MTAGYDGTIRIDSKIDERGFNAGIKGMASSLRGLAAAVGLAFGVGAVVNFGRTAVGAASDLASAVTGLQSVLAGQGRSFAEAQRFINAYTKDGLIPAANAIKAYQNLSLRGYSDGQIQHTLQALKDSSAFGRRAGLSMGDAVQTATEGLRNENSILVDNAGVTKNVARMWDDYAKSIGTTADKLTQAQKIEAEVAGIQEETRFQAGDAAKATNMYSGAVARLGATFLKFKEAFGNALLPILTRVIPVISQVIVWLTALATTFGQVTAALFGQQMAATSTAVAEGAQEAADAQGELADQTQKAGKAAKGALAAFDDLNVLQKDEGAGATDAAGSPEIPVIGTEIGATDAGFAAIEEKVLAFKERLLEMLQPAIDAFGRLKESLGGLGGTVWEGLKWAWENVLVPLGEWGAEKAAPAILDLLAAGADVLNEALIALQPLGTWLWENFLQPAAEWTGQALLDALGWLTERLTALGDWIANNQETFRLMTEIVAGFFVAWKVHELASNVAVLIVQLGQAAGALLANTGAWIANTAAKLADKAETLAIMALYAGDFIRNLVQAALKLGIETGAWIASTAAKIANAGAQLAMNIATGIWNGLAVIAAGVTSAFGAAVAFLTSPIGLVLLAIAALIIIVVLLVKNWDWVKEKAGQVWDWIVEKWGQAGDWFKRTVTEPVKQWFKDAWEWVETRAGQVWENIQKGWGSIGTWIEEHVTGPLKGAFETALDWVKEKWDVIFGGISDLVKGAINNVIGFVNGMIGAVAGGLNAVIDGLNSISITIPDWVPVFGGQQWGIYLPPVYTPQIPYLASGAVIPPNSEFLGMLGDQRSGRNIETPEALLRQIVAEELGKIEAEVRIEFGGSLGALVRMLKPYIDKESVRVGKSLVEGAAP